ncbi:MAG: amino acid adenylation domain-containing protein, partial [Armatimonadetes bacterium]|nr:amino acid adenylation domain-containing protein [Armatimonadota bacterium]
MRGVRARSVGLPGSTGESRSDFGRCWQSIYYGGSRRGSTQPDSTPVAGEARRAVPNVPIAAPILLHGFFDRVVAGRPDQLAVEIPAGEGRPHRVQVTYRELGALVEAVAGRIPVRGDEERIVAILLPRENLWLFAAQIGALRSGAAYVSLEPELPDVRLRQILEDADPAIVLTDAAGAARLARLGIPVPVAQLEAAAGADPQPAESRKGGSWEARSDAGGRLAYLIYTSGSTGRPKGVMIEHRSIVGLIASGGDEFRLGPEDRVAQLSSHAYDSSVEETWLAWAAGATLVVLDDATVRLGPDLVPWLRRERITVLSPTPTLLRSTACRDPQGELPELGLLYVGGEALP